MTRMRPAWTFPAGVDRRLSSYFDDPEVARGYDDSLDHSHLAHVDLEFVARRCPPPGRLLDLGCGTGRLLVAMARHGLAPVGVDLAEEMLRIAGAKASATGVKVQRLKANIAELACLDDGVFDYAACLFSTLGMVCGDEARRQVIGHAFRLLRPGGTLILHVHNYWFNLWTPGLRGWLLRDWLRSWFGRPRGDCPMPAHPPFPAFTLHLFTRREIVNLLRGVGFGVKEIMPLSLRPDGKLAWRAILPGVRAYGFLIAATRLPPL
ncbi:MAG: methyltransferase domain-containing protein [Planctomycetes bacterium]|nr:methyltransferase domain-containing protein [Planctomycetota bacterium]